MSDRLKGMLTKHEGLRLYPYLDTVGKITIGVGRNLSDNGITSDECEAMLQRDMSRSLGYLRALFPGMDGWLPARQDALADMMFNIGPTAFQGFPKMIAAIQAGAWTTAAAEMRDSLWAKQVPARAAELAKMVESGDY